MAVSYGTYTITEVQEGSQIWTTTVAPTTPNYTFTVSNLTGDSETSVKAGDIIMYSFNRYTVLSVSADGTTVLAGNLQSIRGEKGADGTPATTYSLIVSNLAIVKDKSGNISPTSITLTAKSQTGSGTMANYSGRFKIEITTNNSTWTSQYTSSGNESTKTWNVINNIVAIRCSLYLAGGTTTLLDQQTIPIISDGIDGTNGTDGTDGKDAYSVILTNENHTFAGNTTSAVASEIECNIIAYKGTTQIASTIGTITGQPTGMTTSLLNNGTINSAFKVTVTTSMVTRNGILNIPITVDGKTFTKKFSYALTLDGKKGDTAQWYYGDSLTHTSGTATLPVSQTTDVTVGAMYLNTKTGICYKCTAISGTNATWTYAGNITDGIEIGGRNLLKDSNTSTYISKNSAIAHLENGADNVPLQSFVVDIDPVQSGSGDPSPTNIRPISGWNAVNVKNGNTVIATISLGETVYGGTLNPLTGVMTVDRAMVDLGTLTWTKRTDSIGVYFVANKPTGEFAPESPAHTSIPFDGICSIYQVTASNNVFDGSIAMGAGNSTAIYVRDFRYTDASAFTTAMSGVQLVYKLATPVEIQLTPQQIRTLYGQNNIWADTGNVTVNYKTNELIGNASQVIPSGTIITISTQVDANDIIWDTSAAHKRIGVSLSLSKDGGGTQYIEAWASSSDENCIGIVERFNTSFHGRIKYTYTLLGDIVLNRPANLYIQGISSGTVSVSRPKLEIGNKATDWTPAPEDIQEEIDDAKKVATNYLSADNTGIMVADMEDGEQTPSTATGKNVFIDNDSVDIRNGQQVLASFSNNSVNFYETSLNKDVANFGADGVRVGSENEQHFIVDKNSIKAMNEDGSPLFSIDTTAESMNNIVKITNGVIASGSGGMGANLHTLEEGDKVYIESLYYTVTVDKFSNAPIYQYDQSTNYNIAIAQYLYGNSATLVNSNPRVIKSDGDTKVISVDLCPVEFIYQPNSTISKTFRTWFRFINDYGVEQSYSFQFSLRLISDSTGSQLNVSGLTNYDTPTYTYTDSRYNTSEYHSQISNKLYVGTIFKMSVSKAPSMTFGTRGEGGINAPLSVTIGQSLYANNDNQLSIGRYNLNNDEFFPLAFAIGNGTSDNDRSNAFNVDWDGNVENMGDLEVGESLIVGNDLLVNGAQTTKGTLKAEGVFNVLGKMQGAGNPFFKIVTKTIDNISTGVDSGAYPSVAVNESGYTPIAISGITLDRASNSGTTYGWCVVQSFGINGQTLNFYVGNWSPSSAAKIKMVIKVLCIWTNAL